MISKQLKDKIKQLEQKNSKQNKMEISEAIKILRDDNETYKLNKSLNDTLDIEIPKYYQAIETVLEYLQNLEVSNKELDKENNRLEKLEFERDIENKMINEMAIEIKEKVLKKEQWCPLLSKGEGCYDDDTCLKCLKHYFREKAEGKVNV